MKKIFLTQLLVAFSFLTAISQSKTQDFEIALPEQKISNSYYSAISLLDSRYDTSDIGIVQLGVFNRKARVVPVTPLSIQLSNVMTALVDGSAKNGELLLQLRQFNLAEIIGAMSEKGYCYLRADLYAKNGEQYSKTASIDTVIVLKAMDVTKALFRNAGKTLAAFIADNVLKEPAGTISYSYHDIVHIDSIEKRKIPVYNASTYLDGIYNSYQSFMNQAPDKAASVETKHGKINTVKAVNESGKEMKVKPKNNMPLFTAVNPLLLQSMVTTRLKK